MNYKNGNYYVQIQKNGTKTRWALDATAELKPIFPESIDMKITNYCDLGCPYCHEESTTSGTHSNLESENVRILLNSFKEGMEVAIGGGNPLDHPQLNTLLVTLQSKGVIANMTVNQRHLLKYRDQLEYLSESKLVNAFGVSISPAGLSVKEKEFLNKLSEHTQIVLHLIAGINDLKQEDLKGFKALVLGYKTKGRGIEYIDDDVRMKLYNTRELENLKEALSEAELISMDNLAIEQLDPYRFLGEDYKDKHYMGTDGSFSMYVDLVTETFSRSSTEKYREGLKKREIEGIFKYVQEN